MNSHRPQRSRPARNHTIARREAIRRLLRTRSVRSQDALGELLAKEGFDVTQATLSRDLARLRAVRVSQPAGGMAYGFDGATLVASPEQLQELGEMVTSVEENGILVVLLTQPGAASAVARGIDLARLPHVLGSLAGDDTIFLAPERRYSAIKLAEDLRLLFGKANP